MLGEVTRQRSGQHPCEGKTLVKRQARQYLSSAADTMSAKLVAAGESGLAVASSGAGEGGTADPLEEVKVVFTTIRVKITQRDGMINAHNLTVMDNFDYISVDDAGSFIKVWNDTS